MKTLRAQLMVLILVALAAAQILNLTLFANERSLAVRAALGAETAERVAKVVSLLEEVPAALHPSIISTASTRLVRFDVAADPTVDHTTHDLDGRAEARVRAYLSDEFAGAIRAELHEIDSANLPLPYLSPQMAQEHREMMRGQMLAIELKFSIELSDGRWLNAGTLFERPPLQWPVRSFLPFVLSAVFLLAGVFWFVLKQVARPLSKLAKAAETLEPDKKVAVLPTSGPKEIRELAVAFDRMQDRITELVAERTRMLAALGHDLRSPLTAMRVRAEFVTDEETRKSMISLIEDMQQMGETTLAYARGLSDAGQMIETDLGQFLQDLHSEMQGGFTLRHAASVSAYLRPTAIRRAVRNILENALRYGQTAKVTYAKQGDFAVIVVEDDGPGIPPESLEAVFAPYQRLESSRSLETGGHGLGLSIARTILRAHGGDVVLKNRPSGGLRAELSVPLGIESPAH